MKVETDSTRIRAALPPRRRNRINELFRKFSQTVALAAGSKWTFVLSVALVIGWAFSGRRFNYSDTWQLVINTTSSIVTFLMVFLIQNTQNRDAKAIHLKLDELIRAMEGARNRLLNLENLTDEEIDRLDEEFRRLREAATRKRHESRS